MYVASIKNGNCLNEVRGIIHTIKNQAYTLNVLKYLAKLNANSLQEEKLQQKYYIRSDFQLNEMALLQWSNYTLKYGKLITLI